MNSLRQSGGRRESLQEFLEAELPALAAQETRIFDEASDGYDGLVLYGMGPLGQHIAHGLIRAGMPPAAVVDARAATLACRPAGVPLLLPEEAARQFGATHIFVVCVWRDFELLRTMLAGLGCRCVVRYLPLLWKYSSCLLPCYNVELPSRMKEQEGDILRAFDLMADEQSRVEFLFQLRWLTSYAVPDAPPALPLAEQYFPDDLFVPASEDFFVDGGAYDGDTILAWLDRVDQTTAGIVAIEPDPANVIKLHATLSTLPAHLQGKVRIETVGLGRENGSVSFDAAGTVASAIAADGTCRIEIRTLDSLLAGDVPSYIKMDIEGAEVDALHGAAQVLRTHRPRLAVCVYHQQKHMWEVPLLMARLQPAYRLYLRRYRDEFGDVVCYATT